MRSQVYTGYRALVPMPTVVIGCLAAYFGHADKHVIQIVIHFLTFVVKTSIFNTKETSQFPAN